MRRRDTITGMIPLALAVALAALPCPSLFGQDKPIEEAQLVRSAGNLKQLGLACHNFHATYNALPGNITDKGGTALLSWRVAILPYIEEDQLYKEFRRDEAWDSDHNKKLIARMPKIYAPVRGKAKEGETFYQVFTGEKAVFGGKKPLRLTGFLDGTSNTGLIFEAGESVIWTKPADMPFDEKKPLPKLGGLFDGGFHVCMGDGSIRRFKKAGNEAELKKLIMPADGNVISFDKIDK